MSFVGLFILSCRLHVLDYFQYESSFFFVMKFSCEISFLAQACSHFFFIVFLLICLINKINEK